MTGKIFTLGDVLKPMKRALRIDSSAADIALVIERIDLWHRELCALSDWPALQRETLNEVPADGVIELQSGLGVSAVEVSGTHEPCWYVKRTELCAGDLAGRKLWTPSSVGDTSISIAVWQWDQASAMHIPETLPVNVRWWIAPATLTAESDKLSLPGTRALLVHAVCDWVGLMNRTEIDAAPWRTELAEIKAEIKARAPAAMSAALHLPSGRVLHRAPELL
ncbi:MAG: hypothetical protein PHR35_12630 [Kiritimatiellae bacterium]|nr:hypothetical protein [Kiritimatiellia bacterium]